MIAQDTIRSYSAARLAAGWIDRSAEGHIEVRGEDRIAWLQGLLSNDVAALVPGAGCYAAYLTPQGRMISDVRVLAHADRCGLDVPAAQRASVLERLDAFVITEDVTLRDLTPERARLAVHGPRAAAVISLALTGGDGPLEGELAALPEHAHLTVGTPEGQVVVAASFDLGEPGFDLYGPAAAREVLEAAISANGAVHMDDASWHLCRIEAGRPAFGRDMDADTIPLEAGIEDRAISFTKGCYVGQEIIVRVRDRGHGRVARRLVGLVADGPDGDVGDTVAAGDLILAQTRETGRVTSAATSPAVGRTIALGYVHRDHAAPGTALHVARGDRQVAMTVAELPFLRPFPAGRPASAVAGP